jgi:hypothetical protein
MYSSQEENGMNIMSRLSIGLLVSAVSFTALPAFSADAQTCVLNGSYGYVYNGTSYPESGTASLVETGVFKSDANGGFSGEGTLAFQYSNFNGKGPLWVLVRDEQSNGTVTPDTNNPCTGTVSFSSTGTVLKTSNPDLVAVGAVLFTDLSRSSAYTISGQNNEIVDVISTSPGTVASGTAHKQSDGGTGTGGGDAGGGSTNGTGGNEGAGGATGE